MCYVQIWEREETVFAKKKSLQASDTILSAKGKHSQERGKNMYLALFYLIVIVFIVGLGLAAAIYAGIIFGGDYCYILNELKTIPLEGTAKMIFTPKAQSIIVCLLYAALMCFLTKKHFEISLWLNFIIAFISTWFAGYIMLDSSFGHLFSNDDLYELYSKIPAHKFLSNPFWDITLKIILACIISFFVAVVKTSIYLLVGGNEGHLRRGDGERG